MCFQEPPVKTSIPLEGVIHSFISQVIQCTSIYGEPLQIHASRLVQRENGKPEELVKSLLWKVSKQRPKSHLEEALKRTT